jgi:large subunit ribosomal protein L22
MATKPDPQMQVRAQAKWVRMSARKARLVLDNVRGRTVPEARTVLAFTSRAAAREIDRVLASAVANAESAHGLDGDELVVVGAYADEGPTLKRWRARARGRVNRIRKRTCHITVVVAPTAERPRRDQGRKATKPETTEAPVTETEQSEKPSGATEKKTSKPRTKKKQEVAT